MKASGWVLPDVFQLTLWGHPMAKIFISAGYAPRSQLRIARSSKKYDANFAVAVAVRRKRRICRRPGLQASTRVSKRAKRDRSDRGLPAVLCVDFHGPRDRLPHRQWLRPLQGCRTAICLLALGLTEHDGVVVDVGFLAAELALTIVTVASAGAVNAAGHW